MKTSDIDLAHQGYDAYGDFVGWKNYAGLPMPKWEELPQKIRDAWTVAAARIENLVQAGTTLPASEE